DHLPPRGGTRVPVGQSRRDPARLRVRSRSWCRFPGLGSEGPQARRARDELSRRLARKAVKIAGRQQGEEGRMKALVIARPKYQIAPEQAAMVVQRGIEWYDRYKDRFTEFGTFLGGGGFGVVEVDTTDELGKMIAEMPFSAFMDITAELY